MPRQFIVLLEDDERRLDAMRRCLADRVPQYPVVVFASSQQLCRWLDQHLEAVLLISLDHDLAVETLPDGRLLDQGTGLEVARYLAQRRPRFPVILHSSNSDGVASMEAALHGADWRTWRVIPFDDLAWIRREWRNVVRDCLVELAEPAAPAAAIPPQIVALVQRLRPLCRSEQFALEKSDERLLRRWLTHVLRRTSVLAEYVDGLRQTGEPLSELILLPWARARRVLRSGLRPLTSAELVYLAFNPVALYDLHDRISERQPTAWRRRSPALVTLRFEAKVGEPRLLEVVADHGGQIRVYASDLPLKRAGRVCLTGLLEWNCKTEGGRPLRLADARNREELLSVAPNEEPPVWIDQGFLDKEFRSGSIAYLSLPIAVDESEIHGVLRFIKFAAHDDGKPADAGRVGFTTYDEQAATAATARLAAVLQREREQKRARALEWLLKALGGVLTQRPRHRARQQVFARMAFRALHRGLGRCSCGLRLADEVVEPDGGRRFALRRLAWKDPDWERVAPAYRFEEDSPAVRAFRSGHLLEDEDLERGVSSPERDAQLNQKYSNPLVKRLGGEAGTIYAARYAATRPGSGEEFSPAEKVFFEKVAEIVGRGMLRIAEYEQLRLENAILRRLVDNFGGASLPAALGEILAFLKDMLYPDWACVWIPTGASFEAIDAEGRPLLIEPLSVAALVSEVGHAGPRAVTLPKTEEQEGALAPLFQGAAPEDWAHRERAALPIRNAAGVPVAVFALAARRSETLSVQQLDRLVDFLTCVAPFVERLRPE